MERVEMNLKEFVESLDIDIPTFEETFRMVSSGTVSLGRMPGKTKVYKHFNNILIALSKQIAKTCNINNYMVGIKHIDENDNEVVIKVVDIEYRCPTCDKVVKLDTGIPKHCEECGQALRYIK